MGIQIVALPREEDEQRSPSSGRGADPREWLAWLAFCTFHAFFPCLQTSFAAEVVAAILAAIAWFGTEDAVRRNVCPSCWSILCVLSRRSAVLTFFFCLSKIAILRLNSSTPSDDFLLMCQDNSGVAFSVFQKRPKTNPQSYQKGLPCHAIISTSSTYKFPSFLWIFLRPTRWRWWVLSARATNHSSEPLSPEMWPGSPARDCHVKTPSKSATNRNNLKVLKSI